MTLLMDLSFPTLGNLTKIFKICQIPTPCPHSPPLTPHGVYIDRCIILGKGCPSRQGKSKILLLLLLYLYLLVSFEEFISFRFSFQLLLVLHSLFNVTTVPKATHSRTRAFREDLRLVTLGDSVLQMTPSYASSGVAIKGHVT